MIPYDPQPDPALLRRIAAFHARLEAASTRRSFLGWRTDHALVTGLWALGWWPGRVALAIVVVIVAMVSWLAYDAASYWLAALVRHVS